jgi:hypothetical protein
MEEGKAEERVTEGRALLSLMTHKLWLIKGKDGPEGWKASDAEYNRKFNSFASLKIQEKAP